MDENESILKTIKKMIGASEDEFDTDLIIHINSVFSNLFQMGVGPKETFKISGEIEKWTDFTEDNNEIENVKTYIYIKVKLIFDPPANSFVITSMKEEEKELEYRLFFNAENRRIEEQRNA